MLVFDAHAHAGDPAENALRQAAGVRTMLSCGNPVQAERALALAAQYSVFTLTAGVHPWYAEKTTLEAMEPYMERAALVGEIGLDSVWCDTPMPIQRARFVQQLDWAASHGKGVVLHTKGCEREIAAMVRDFPGPVVVHWYSGDLDGLEAFLQRDCYFTIGPDVTQNPCVQAVARLAADERILFETDGMDAVRWALGDVKTEALPDVLASSVRTAAQLRGQDAESLAKCANDNYLRLING